MEIVAGLHLVSVKPRVWDADSPYHLDKLNAVMVSYVYFHQSPSRRNRAMKMGLHSSLDVPKHIKIYLDNGAFRFSKDEIEVPRQAYVEFVERAKPNWYAIPQDYIPTPRMSDDEQIECLQRTMAVNREYSSDGYVPILHISRYLDMYLSQFEESYQLRCNPIYAIGGIVPNLLRAPKSMSSEEILHKVRQVRATFANRELHLFGVGGTATLHIAALLGIDSIDSAGWRVRAARGIIQLPGTADRSVANLGNWKVPEPNPQELEKLKKCRCPACQRFGLPGLQANRTFGYCNRASHNLWTLLEENRMIRKHLEDDTYTEWYEGHLYNSRYRPLIDKIIKMRNSPK